VSADLKAERVSDARFVQENGLEAFFEALACDHESGGLSEEEYNRRREWVASYTEPADDTKVVSLASFRAAKTEDAKRITAAKARAAAVLADPYGALLEDLRETLAHAVRVIERERSKPKDAS
jgi:hypothetical protein